MPAEWVVQSLDRNGAAKDLLEPLGLTIDRRLNDATSCSFTVTFEDDMAPDVSIGDRAVAVYRDKTLVFCGPIVALTWSGDDAGGSSVAVQAEDPFGVLKRRFLAPLHVDNFTDTNGTALTAHTSDSGMTYTRRSGDTGVASIHNNRLYVSTGSGETYFDTGVDSSRPYEVELELHHVSAPGSMGSTNWWSIGFHYDAALDDGVLCSMKADSGGSSNGECFVQGEVADSRSNIKTSPFWGTDGGGAPGNGDRFRLRWEVDADGDIRCWRNDELTIYDAQYATRTSGNLVFGFLNTSGQTTTTGPHVEWWRINPQTSWEGIDAGTIATDLLDIANAQEETHLRAGTIDTSVNRDRKYDIGKNLGEAITQLAEVENGFWFRVDAALSGAQFGTLEIEYSASGVDQPDVRFEYGPQTLDNLSSYQVAEEVPANYILALGADGSSNFAIDRSSTSTNGRWGAVESLPDVKSEVTLQEHANDALEANPRRLFSVSPKASEIESSIDAPRLYVDFDVGDTCRLSIGAGGYQVDDVTVRVLAATLQVSDDGEIEELSSLVIEEV